MESTLIPGIPVILWLQSLGDWLLGLMNFFSALGMENFYLLIAPAVFWCLDPGFGVRLGIGLMISSSTNAILKLAFHGPRPYWVDPQVQPLAAETSFGAPSGHAQNAVMVWGLGAHRLKKGWGWTLAVFLILMIGVSRMYLGVHFPTDVFLGWLAGGISLWLVLRLEKPLMAWFLKQRMAAQILFIFAVSIGLILGAALVRLPLLDWTIPSGWVELANRIEDANPINPLSLSGAITPSAALFGLATGAVLLRRWGWLDAAGPLWQRLLRFAVGAAGVILIWSGLDMVFPSGDSLVAYVFRFLRYALVGLWISYLAPLVFYRLKLAHPAVVK